MSDLFALTRINARNQEDVVSISFGRAEVRVFYQAALDIAHSMRLAAKLASRTDGLRGGDWREVSSPDAAEEAAAKRKTHRGYRRSRQDSNIRKWAVSFEGSLVVLKFDNTPIKMSWNDALVLHGTIRNAALDAKAWAGDRSKTMRGKGYLNDAEENYRLGYN